MEPNRSTSSFPSQEANDWQRAYELVLQEADDAALFKCIEVAEAAILTRREFLLSSATHPEELKAIEDALAHVRFLKRSRLGFDDLQKERPTDH